MRKALLAFLAAAPLSLLGAATPAHADSWNYYGYSTPYSNTMLVNGPGGYSGYGWGMGNMGMYSDNYGTTTCMAVGNSVMCF